MTVVNTEALEVLGHKSRVLGHVLPKKRVIFRTVSVAEFDAITPDNDFSP